MSYTSGLFIAKSDFIMQEFERSFVLGLRGVHRQIEHIDTPLKFSDTNVATWACSLHHSSQQSKCLHIYALEIVSVAASSTILAMMDLHRRQIGGRPASEPLDLRITGL